MSPFYERWLGELGVGVPKDLRNKVKDVLGEKELRRLIQGGLGFKVNGEREVAEVRSLSELPEGVILDSKKEKSPWHVVQGLEDPQKLAEKSQQWGDYTLEDANLHRGHLDGRYRGKHRSHTKGAGALHAFRARGGHSKP